MARFHLWSPFITYIHHVVALIHNGPKHLSHQTLHVTILATHSLRSHQNIVPNIAMSSSSNTP